MAKLNINFQYVLIFLFTFIVGLILLDLFSSKEEPEKTFKNNPIHEYSKMPSTVTEFNGKKVREYSGVANMSAANLAAKMKEDILANPDLKMINESEVDNKLCFTYIENGVSISAVITNQSDGTCNYRIYKAEESIVGDEQPIIKSYAAMPDAVPVLNLKGKDKQNIFSYTTKYSKEEVIAFYRSDMVKKGYREEKVELPPEQQITIIDSTEIYFIKDRKFVSISITSDPSDNSTMVYIVGS